MNNAPISVEVVITAGLVVAMVIAAMCYIAGRLVQQYLAGRRAQKRALYTKPATYLERDTRKLLGKKFGVFHKN